MSINTEKFLEDARKLTEQRMAAAEKIVQAIATRVAAEDALKEAEAQERKAYREAERNGWTKAELNKLKPTKKRGTPQKKTTPPKTEDTTHKTSSQNNGGVSQVNHSVADESSFDSRVNSNA